MLFEQMTISPAMAKHYLSKNHPENRPIKRQAVKSLAMDIKDGGWVLNPRPIVIDTNGILIDGQHRLSAVVEANESIEAIVCFGADPEVFEVLDNGGAGNRALSYALTLPNRIVSSVRAYKMGLSSEIVTVQKFKTMYEESKEQLAFVEEVFPKNARRRHTGPIIRGRVMAAYDKYEDKEKLARFVEILDSCVPNGLPESAPAKLHRWLYDQKTVGGGDPKKRIFTNTEWCIEKFMSGTPVFKMKIA